MMVAPRTVSLALPPTLSGYSIGGGSVVPVAHAPVAAPVMMHPDYGMPAYTPITVYNAGHPGAVLPPGGNPAFASTARPAPKPLTEEV